MDRRSGVTNCFAGCHDCGPGDGLEAIWFNPKNALACAAAHAKRTGHSTWADQTISVNYNPKD